GAGLELDADRGLADICIQLICHNSIGVGSTVILGCVELAVICLAVSTLVIGKGVQTLIGIFKARERGILATQNSIVVLAFQQNIGSLAVLQSNSLCIVVGLALADFAVNAGHI